MARNSDNPYRAKERLLTHKGERLAGGLFVGLIGGLFAVVLIGGPIFTAVWLLLHIPVWAVVAIVLVVGIVLAMRRRHGLPLLPWWHYRHRD